MSRETRVRRTPATGRIPKRLSTATWLWPPPTSTMSVATGADAGAPEFMFALFGIGEFRRPGRTGSGRAGNGGRGWESNPPDTSHASHRI